jgi:hypothetical protein
MQVIEVIAMRKFLFVAIVALLGTLGLSACSSGNQQATTSEAKATRPGSADVDNAIKACRAKHPGAAAPAPSATASAPSGTAAAADAVEEDDPCARATISAATWQAYLQELVTANLAGVTSNPYVYFVPSGKYPENQGAIGRVQDSLNGTVAATVLPGNMVAVAGPDSATTAQLLITAFKNASPGSFKGVVVLFIGDKADEAAVQQALAPSGATFKFAQM